MQGIIHQNLVCLEQGLALLEQIEAKSYTQKDKTAMDACIGDHMRHSLDFFETFFAGLDRACVDYEARQRDTRVATDPKVAYNRLMGYRERLVQLLEGEDKPLKVESDSEEDGPSDSTLSRELNFLLSHTVHHFALIAYICRSIGVSLPQDFGVAGSTLRYKASLKP